MNYHCYGGKLADFIGKQNKLIGMYDRTALSMQIDNNPTCSSKAGPNHTKWLD